MTYKIKLDSDFSSFSIDLEYSFEPLVQEKQDGRNRELTTIANQDPEAARHFAFQPGQSNPTLKWTIYNNGEDKSNNTLSNSNITDSRFSNGTITTVDEQIIWLTEYIMDNTSDPRWLFFGGRFADRNGDGTDEGTNVTLQNLQHRKLAGLNAARANLDMKLGVTF